MSDFSIPLIYINNQLIKFVTILQLHFHKVPVGRDIFMEEIILKEQIKILSDLVSID